MIKFSEMGVQDYSVIWQQMVMFTQNRTPSVADEIWLLEHYPVFTSGTSASSEDIIGSLKDIPIVKTDRGGQITYHGPGQLIGYVLFDLRRRNLRIKALVSLIERAIIDMLVECSINAHILPDYPGVYVDNCKIASLGLKMSRGCCYHGFSINVDMDLTPFSYINPCGMKNLHVVNVSELSKGIDVEKMIPICKRHLVQCFE